MSRTYVTLVMPHLLKKVQKAWWKLRKSLISRARKRKRSTQRTNVPTPSSYLSSQKQSKKPDGIYESPQVLDLGIVQTLGKGSTQRTNVATLHRTSPPKRNTKYLIESMKILKFST